VKIPRTLGRFLGRLGSTGGISDAQDAHRRCAWRREVVRLVRRPGQNGGVDLSGVDWGSVPAYLAVFGIAVGIGTWAKERRQEREEDKREREAQKTGVAMVIAYCTPPSRIGKLERGLNCIVKSLAGTPVFDVELSVRYVGQSDRVPGDLRHHTFEATVVAGNEKLDESVAAEKWPEIDYHVRDFEWELRFTDVQGKRWRRKRTGMPTAVED
jgi:hypothetical protein